jgi:hypothetical protein
MHINVHIKIFIKIASKIYVLAKLFNQRKKIELCTKKIHGSPLKEKRYTDHSRDQSTWEYYLN